MCDGCWTCETNRRIQRLEEASCADDKSLSRMVQTIGDIDKRLTERVKALEGVACECSQPPYNVGAYHLREPKGRGREIVWSLDFADHVVAHWNGYALLLNQPYQIETARSDDFWDVVKEGMRRIYD